MHQPPIAPQAAPTPGQPVRSEGLLPDDPSDPAPEVAEEVSTDAQSARARQVGSLPAETPPDKPQDALAEALRPGAPADLEERLPPPQ
jgi:hypothetical protein